MATITADALVKYAERYEKKLFSTLINQLAVRDDITVMTTVRNAVNMTKLGISGQARPFTSKWQGKDGQLNFTGRQLKAEPGKREVPIDPSDFWDTWMTELRSEGLMPKDLPFAQYIFNRIRDEFVAEINDHITWEGFDKSKATAYSGTATYNVGDYVTYGTDGDYYRCEVATSQGEDPVGTPAKWTLVNNLAITEGFKDKIKDEISGANLTAVSTGSITSTNAYDQFTEMFRSMTAPYRAKGVTIFCSQESAFKLDDDFESKVGKYTEIDQQTGERFLAKTGRKCRIKPVTWMGDSEGLIATRKENLLMGTDAVSDFNRLHTHENHYTIDLSIVFSLGYQIRDLDAMRVNDQI